MNQTQLRKIRLLIQKKPYLIWSTKNYDNLSAQSILASVISYGDWQDFLELKSILGMAEIYRLFKESEKNKRSNIRPQTRNYFKRYFARYA